jgi:ATP-binding cassette subfamily F protein 3
LFTGDDVFKRIKVLSGGEKSRVALAKALTADANFLILDEPTNHLDIQSVNILIQALKQFEGTFTVVSHDRYLLDNVANKIWFIEDQQIKEYPGTYAEYEEWQAKRPAKSANPTPAPVKEIKKVENTAVQEDKSKALKKLNQEISTLEQSLASLKQDLSEIETTLAKPEIYGDVSKLSEHTTRYEEVKSTLNQTQVAWEALAEQILELESC